MMQNYNYKYYEPLEQMIAVRHQYMSKVIKKITHLNIYEYLKNKKILDIGLKMSRQHKKERTESEKLQQELEPIDENI